MDLNKVGSAVAEAVSGVRHTSISSFIPFIQGRRGHLGNKRKRFLNGFSVGRLDLYDYTVLTTVTAKWHKVTCMRLCVF